MRVNKDERALPTAYRAVNVCDFPPPLITMNTVAPLHPNPPVYTLSYYLLFPKGFNILLESFYMRKLFKSKYESSETETFRNFLNWKIIYEFPCS